ncbi:MAG: hypothetical protein ABI894_10035 [Ilumatobacteraceae bacterium]
MQMSAVVGEAPHATERATLLGSFAAWVLFVVFVVAVLAFILICLSQAISLLFFAAFAAGLIVGVIQWVDAGSAGAGAGIVVLSLAAGALGRSFAAIPSRPR